MFFFNFRWAGGPICLIHQPVMGRVRPIFLDSTLNELGWVGPFIEWVEVGQTQRAGLAYFDSSNESVKH